VSLHLSFLATVGIVYFSKDLSYLFKKIWRHNSSREVFVTTLSAYLATLPYVMYTFGKVSVYALLANILVVPLVPACMLLSFLVILCSYISETLTLLFGFLDSSLIGVILWFARTVEHIPFASLTVTITRDVMFVLYFVLYIFLRFAVVLFSNETRQTIENGNLTDIISY
jgi:competence protein ComEC